MKQAARLRADAEELETVQSEFKEKEKLEMFKTFDIDGSGAVDKCELQMGWKQLKGEELDKAMIVRMWSNLDINNSGALELDEFDLSRVQLVLEKLKAEDEKNEFLAQEEAQRQEELEAMEKLKEYRSKPPGTDDTGLQTRVLSAMAYVLPLMDVAKLGLPLAMLLIPTLFPALGFVVSTAEASAFGFGPLILFLAYQYLCAQQDKPALLRFSLRQSILLDIAIILPNILRVCASAVDNHIIEFLIMCVGFIGISVCCAWGMASSLAGEPSNIPFFSETAIKNLHDEQGTPTVEESKETKP